MGKRQRLRARVLVERCSFESNHLLAINGKAWGKSLTLSELIT